MTMFSYLVSYLYIYYFHIATYLSVDTIFPFSVPVMKMVVHQKHRPNQGILVS